MLVTLSALIAAAAMPLGPITSRDSTRALRVAHRAQGDFEALRRQLLPHGTLIAAPGCDAVVGRYCFLQQVASAAPQEAPEVVAGRLRLLATLDSVSALIPGDRWILGQRVRYLVEAGHAQSADSLGVACAASATDAATKSWCFALVGYTAQQYGKFARADGAFSLALDELPEAERRKFEDLALFIGGRAARPYRNADRSSSDSAAAAFWRLVQPLYLTGENDLRTELLARITRMHIEQDSRTVMGDWFRGDDRETLLRYGIALWYTQGDPRPGALGPPPIAGIRRQPSFNFFPDAHAFSSPDQLTPDDWAYQNVDNGPTYAPTWAWSFLPLINHQVALFRRGDSAFVVASFAVNDASHNTPREAGIFAATIDHGGVLQPFGTTIQNASSKIVSTLMAPWRPLIVSLEVLDSANHAAERARFAPRLPVPGTRLSLSDLLLYAPSDSVPLTSLKDAVPLALHAMEAPSNRQIGVFWETYGVRPEGEAFDYSLIVEPVDKGLIHRALVAVHVVDPDRGLSLQWRETPSISAGIASRSVVVDLSRLQPGQYLVRLMLTSGTELPVVAERSIQVF